MPHDTLRVVCYGLGPIGAETLRLILERPDLHLVGAIDVDPVKAGKDAGEVAGVDRTLGVMISSNAERSLTDTRPDVVVHCTGSRLVDAMPQLQGILAAGASVVSTCEELSYPWTQHRDLAAVLDISARAHDVSALGTGVNPGFVMDFLPLVLSSVTARVSSVRVVRVVDAAARRGPLQRKIGAGLDTTEFERRVATGSMGHIGLMESLHLIAAGVHWNLRETNEVLEPVIASEPLETLHARVAPGTVAGIHQIARGRTEQDRFIELELWMYMGAANPRDEIVIEGDPGVRVIIPGGIFGDSATAAIVANAIPSIQRMTPGLHTMLDMPPIPPALGPAP